MRLFRFLRALARNRSRRVDLPRFLTYTVTFTCNARCIMCDSWKMESPEDLSLEELDRIFSQLPTLDAVRLTGGEPFVRRDMIEIAGLVKKRLKPLVLHVTTNGFLTDRIVKFCEDRPRDLPLHLLVSVDGVESKHNEVRGRENAWKTATATLKALAPRRKELGLRLGVNQTIVDAEGVEHYTRLREFLKPMGVHNNVVMAYDVSATYSVERDRDLAPKEMGQFTTFGEFTSQHIQTLVEEIERDLADFPFLERIAKRYYLKGITNRLLGNHAAPNPKCVALNAHLRMFPNGDVPTCQFNSKVVGNLRHQTFKEVWSSAKIAEQRQWVNRCPGCWAECEVLPSAIYTGDLVKETLLPSRKKPRQNSPSTRPSAAPSGVSA
jgi:MoaA/NifB/PqqE/SkfB family radical SAM enzyme